MIQIKAINHVTLSLDDLEKAREFYTTVLGLSRPDAGTVAAAVWEDERVEQGEVFISGRGDARGTRAEDATLYHASRGESD
jgi:catechol 2,3-dioxygenase-like lactoylglutathione lyase family enzyme